MIHFKFHLKIRQIPRGWQSWQSVIAALQIPPSERPGSIKVLAAAIDLDPERTTFLGRIARIVFFFFQVVGKDWEYLWMQYLVGFGFPYLLILILKSRGVRSPGLRWLCLGAGVLAATLLPLRGFEISNQTSRGFFFLIALPLSLVLPWLLARMLISKKNPEKRTGFAVMSYIVMALIGWAELFEIF